MRALIVIDYTFDFIADSGRLTCGKPGQEIEERIVELIGTFATEDYVVIANDVHDAGDTFTLKRRCSHRTISAGQRAVSCTVR